MHTQHFEVRDYECDAQGIVNNAVYQHYFEHARHQYLKSLGLDFMEYARSGINLVVYRAEIDYKKSLAGGDQFRVETRAEVISPVRIRFEQHIIRDDELLMVKGKIFATGMSKSGRPQIPRELLEVLGG